MHHRARTITTLASTVCAAALTSAVVVSQAPTTSAPAKTAAVGKAAPDASGKYVPPRTPDGQPDITGMYEPGWIGQPLETPAGERWRPPTGGQGPAGAGFANDFGGRDAVESDPNITHARQLTTPMIVDPPDGKVPLQPWALAKRAEILNNFEKAENLDPRVRCLQAGVPRANMPVYYNSYQILQKPGYVVIVYEWNHMTRIIPLDGRPHLDPRIRLANGDSRGRWEGNTLVVDVTNFNDDAWVAGHGSVGDNQPPSSVTSGHGVFHSPELHVVERFTPIERNIIRYEATVEDPKVFTRPWTLRYDAFFRGAKDHQLFEYACHEGNRDAMLMMLGLDIDPDQQVPEPKKSSGR